VKKFFLTASASEVLAANFRKIEQQILRQQQCIAAMRLAPL
jgi:hypothetical protein